MGDRVWDIVGDRVGDRIFWKKVGQSSKEQIQRCYYKEKTDGFIQESEI